MSNNKNTSGVFGKGYYIALILCAAAIGITGFLYYRNAGEEETLLQDPAIQVAPEDAEQDVAAVATQPQPTTPGTTPTEGTVPPTKKPAMKTTSPVAGDTVASYAMDCLSYNQTTRDWRVHNGMDIAAPAGTQVVAAADGVVYTTFTDDSYGTTVVIRHEDGYTTQYASLAEDLLVKAGESVTMGQAIGCVGSTALLENALGDHVHFSVTCQDIQMDPEEFLSLESH